MYKTKDVLTELCVELAELRADYMRDNYYYEPEMNVSFSPDGYYKTLSCPSAKILFSGVWSEDKQTINGCPFKIDINQKSDFIVKMAQKIKGDIYE